GEGVEMGRLPGGLNVAGPRVLAVDRLFGDERFEARDRLQRGVKELPRASLSKSRNERGRFEPEPGENLTAVARARAPADLLALKHDDRGARAREVPGGGQARISGAHDRDIPAGFGIRDLGFAVRGSGFGIRDLGVAVRGSGFVIRDSELA